MQAWLEQEARAVNPQDLTALETQLQDLVWGSGLNAVNPGFPCARKDLSESDHGVGEYAFLSMFLSPSGSIARAVHRGSGTYHAIKIVDKSRVVKPGTVEGIFREYRFLCKTIQHPNIAHCSEMLHA